MTVYWSAYSLRESAMANRVTTKQAQEQIIAALSGRPHQHYMCETRELAKELELSEEQIVDAVLLLARMGMVKLTDTSAHGRTASYFVQLDALGGARINDGDYSAS
jgi:hypothetical protein